MAFAPEDLWEAERYSDGKREFLRRALADGAARAGDYFQCPSGFAEVGDIETAITKWAADHGIDTVLALRPFVGPLADRLPAITQALSDRGIRFVLIRRPEDVAAMNEATAGFFKFREKTASLR
jgi:hypothetical protein